MDTLQIAQQEFFHLIIYFWSVDWEGGGGKGDHTAKFKIDLNFVICTFTRW